MKRTIIMLLLFMLFFSMAHADQYEQYVSEQFDFESMTDEQLEGYVRMGTLIVERAQEELNKRSSVPEKKNIGISTIEFLGMFEGFLEPYGLPYWELDMEENEKDDRSITKLITADISIVVYQSEEMVTEFWIVTDLGDTSNSDQINNLTFCIMDALMITDLEMSADEAITYATQIIQGKDLTRNGLNYHYSTSPLTTAVAFKVTVAD